MSDRSALRPFAFVLAVEDLAKSAAYFRDALGFEVEWSEADDWRCLSRGTTRFMIGNCPGVTPAKNIGDHSFVAYLEVDDVDAVHREYAANGAIISQPPADRPYGMREMLVSTPDGHRIMIGQRLLRSGSSAPSIAADNLNSSNDE